MKDLIRSEAEKHLTDYDNEDKPKHIAMDAFTAGFNRCLELSKQDNEDNVDEYTKEEILINGNQMYGGKRHDEICDYLQKAYGFNETQINDISMGVWKGIESEKNKNLSSAELKDVRIMELENKLKVTVEALEWIAKTDTSDNGPDVLWLTNWRNTRKQAAIDALKQLAE
jgi:hypothetical protein